MNITDNAVTDYAIYMDGDLVAARRHALPEEDAVGTDIMAAAIAARLGFDVTIRFSNEDVAFIAEHTLGEALENMTIEVGPVAFDGEEME